MKSLSTYSKIAAVFVLIGVSSMMGCKPGLVDPVGQNNPLQFASLRIVNFTSSDAANENCTPPLDVYYHPASVVGDTLANVNNLPFGGASPYASSLPADPNGTDYVIDTRYVRSQGHLMPDTHITLKAGHRYSYVIYNDPSNTTSFVGKLVEDGAPTPPGDPKKVTYVRFMNVNPGDALTATVNSPSGDVLASNLAYREVGPYVALNTALDTSYAFDVFSDPSNVIGKITFQSFAPGSYHTIVYGGDPCRFAPHVTTGDALDSFRVRVLDDNTLGNEETSPVPSSIRYFIVNAMIPSQDNANDGLNQWWAYIVANDANPNRHNFTFNPVQTFQPVPNYGSIDGNGIQDIYYSSTVLAPWIEIKGYTVDNANGDNQKLIFDVHAQRSNMVAENSYAIVFFDTLPGKKSDSSALGKTMTSAQISDNRDPNKVSLTLINAVAPSKKYPSTSPSNTATFSVNGSKIPFGGTVGKSINTTTDIGDLNITASVGTSTTLVDAGSVSIPGAKGGEQYIVVMMGQRSDGDFSSPYPARIKVYRVR